MSAPPPVAYDGLMYSASRLVNAHRYFAGRAREWLQADGAGNVQSRASAVERSVRELIQMVVIDLTAEENAQEIFETLNARGAQLTAADLIKNFVFQRLTEAGDDVENAYDQFWKEFETGFWESRPARRHRQAVRGQRGPAGRGGVRGVDRHRDTGGPAVAPAAAGLGAVP